MIPILPMAALAAAFLLPQQKPRPIPKPPKENVQTSEAANGELLLGVEDIGAPGAPSPIQVWNPDAWVVLVGNGGKGLKSPAVVAGRASLGRFVVFPHEALFGASALGKGQTGRMMANAAHWAAGAGKPKPKVAARTQEIVDLLNQKDCDAHLMASTPTALQDELASADVLFGISNEIAEGDFEPLERFLYRGGGLVAGQCASAWKEANPALASDANPLNRFFRRFGVAWSEGYLGRLGDVGFTVERSPPKLAHGDAALAFLNNKRDPGKVDKDHPMLQATLTGMAVIALLPDDDAFQRSRLVKLAADFGDKLVATPETPIAENDGARRVALAFALRAAEHAPVEETPALACAKSFPGEIAAGAPRVAKSVEIDAAIPRWHSTGLYAAPGEAIRVRLPSAGASGDAAKAGLVLQIGAHPDELAVDEEWQRVPRATRRAPLDRAETRLASPVGGLVYVDVPEGCTLGKIEIAFDHVVEAPRFVLDRTTLDDWRAAQRAKPAPWAELESLKVIVTVPSASIRGLEDPEALMRAWDRAADAAADLVALPRARQSPERFVVDVQTAAGSAQRTYPVIVHAESAGPLSDPAKLAHGDFALFRSLGELHRSEDWTLDDSGRAMSSLIALHLLEVVSGRTPTAGDRDFALVDDGAKRIAAHLAGGAPLEEWRRDPALALQPWLQVERAFGWEPFRKTFADYRGMPRREKPKNDEARRDLWLITLSRATKHDLGPFFAKWGLPTSEAARRTVADLPAWMPEGFPPP